MSHLMRLAVVCAACFSGTFLHAEIEKVSVIWQNPSICQDSCVKGLTKQFSALQGVADVEINQAAGQAILRWKPDVPFTFTAIHNAMAMIGLYIKEIRVSVSGTVSHTDQSVRLTSTTDGTPFVLLGPIQASPTQYVQQYSIATHALSPDMRANLLQFEQDNQTITVDGPLFEPYRSPPAPLQIIAERISAQNQQ